MSSEYTMDAATASEAKDVAQAAPPGANANKSVRFPHGAPPPAVNAHMSLPVLDSPAPEAGARAQQPQGSQQESKHKQKDDATWFDEMRGWLSVVAVQIASSTYQAGLNTPSGFSGDTLGYRYNIFFYSNMTAFLTSLAIIILLVNKSFFYSKHKVTVLVTILVLDMVGLMAAYWASTTNASKDHTGKYALVLTVFVLFVVYVAFAVQLLTKLKTLWCEAAAAAVAAAAVVAAAAPRRVHAGDAAPGGAAPVPSQIDEARSSSTSQQRLTATPRRRGSKRSAAIEPSRMMSP